MRKPDPIEQALHAVLQVTEARELAPFLRSRSALVAARAAKRAAEMETRDLAPELVESFRRFMKDPAKLDRGCQALIGIATALTKSDAPVAEVYSAGIRHRQMEASFGPPVDAAAPLRAICAIGLARMEYSEALFDIADLLVDRWPEARIGAIRALAESGRPEAELLLRYKALSGDEDGEVVGESFSAVLRIGPRIRAVPFVAKFLDHSENEVIEASALALGESRFSESLPLLAEALARKPAAHGSVLWAIALLRNDQAIDFLFRQLADGSDRTAALALEALALYKADAVIRNRTADAVAASTAPAVRKVWYEHWQAQV